MKTIRPIAGLCMWAAACAAGESPGTEDGSSSGDDDGPGMSMTYNLVTTAQPEGGDDGNEDDPSEGNPTDDGKDDASSGGASTDASSSTTMTPPDPSSSTGDDAGSSSTSPIGEEGTTVVGDQETLQFTNSVGLPLFGETLTPATQCLDVVVPSDGMDTVVEMSMTLAANHTWIGDVQIELRAPNDTALTVLNRAGHPLVDGNGYDSDISDQFPLQFTDDAATSAEQLGVGLLPTEISCHTDGICDYAPAPDIGGSVGGLGTDFADFAGVSSVGAWTVCFTDHLDMDGLTVTSVTLTITKSAG